MILSHGTVFFVSFFFISLWTCVLLAMSVSMPATQYPCEKKIMYLKLVQIYDEGNEHLALNTSDRLKWCVEVGCICIGCWCPVIDQYHTESHMRRLWSRYGHFLVAFPVKKIAVLLHSELRENIIVLIPKTN